MAATSYSTPPSNIHTGFGSQGDLNRSINYGKINIVFSFY
jgi:hypothetical protein